jgi:ABC-2 type transport system ATP-binding protein
MIAPGHFERGKMSLERVMTLQPGEVTIQGLGKRYWFRSAGGPEEDEDIDSGDDEATGGVFSIFGPRTEVWALRNLSCHIDAGERLAIVGTNGAGKSTLINILARMLPPSEGTVTGAGRVVPFTALRRVLSPDVSACENLKLLGRLIGMPSDLLEERIPQIVEFSELGQLAYEKASRLSAGSFSRLAMAMPLFSDADIYLIDDEFKISDQAYRLKFQKKFTEILSGRATVVLASNNLGLLRSYCRRALWLERGELVAQGEVSSIIEDFLSRQEALLGVASEQMPDPDLRLVARITSWVRRRLEVIDDPKDVRSELDAYANVARERTKLNRDLTEAEIIAAMAKKPWPAKTIESELQRVDKVLTDLIAGAGGLRDQHESTLRAHEHVRERLNVITEEMKIDATQEADSGARVIQASSGDRLKVTTIASVRRVGR